MDLKFNSQPHWCCFCLDFRWIPVHLMTFWIILMLFWGYLQPAPRPWTRSPLLGGSRVQHQRVRQLDLAVQHQELRHVEASPSMASYVWERRWLRPKHLSTFGLSNYSMVHWWFMGLLLMFIGCWLRLYWCLSMFIDVYGEFGKSYRTGICSKYSDAFQHCWRTTLTKVGLGVWRTARGHRSNRQNSDEFWRSMTQINRSSTTFRNLGDQAARILDTYFTGTTPWMFFLCFGQAPSAPYVITSSATDITLGWDYVGKDLSAVMFACKDVKSVMPACFWSVVLHQITDWGV